MRGGTGEILSRIRAERGSPRGDLMWGGSLEAFTANAELFAPLDLGEEDAFLARDPRRLWHPFTANLIHLVVNTERVRGPLPAGFRDLLLPRFAALGPVAFSNPAVSGTGYTVTAALAASLGWDYLAALLRNAWLTDSSDAMFKWVKDGETAAGFLFETTLRDDVAAGAPLAPVLAEEGLISQTDGAGLIAGAPHPEAAAAFLAYLSSVEAHEIVRTRVGRRSARRGIAPADGLLDVSGRTLIQPEASGQAGGRALLLARFEEARERAGR